MQHNREILIEKFFEKALSAEEQQQFDKLLREDAAFKEEVELHGQVVAGIKKYGDDNLRLELAAIHAEVKGEMEGYEPTNGGGNGLWILSQLIIAICSLTIGASYFITPEGKLEVNIPAIEKRQIEQNPGKGVFTDSVTIERETYVRIETVYHTIQSSDVLPGDTITFYNESDLKKFKEEHEIRKTQ